MMSEIDDLKKKTKETFELAGQLLSAQCQKFLNLWNQKDASSTKRLLLTGVVLAFLLLGFVSGTAAMMGSVVAGVGSKINQNGEQASLLQFVFQRRYTLPGKQKDGSFVFSNFERARDVKAWQAIAAHVEISEKRPASGKQSAQVTYFGGGEVSAFTLEDYFQGWGALRNWSSYESFRLYIFNPRNETERLILQIKDLEGKRYKEDLHVPGGSGKEFSIPVTKIGASINVRNIDQFSIFRWEPKNDLDFYFDDIRLVPKGFQEQEDARVAATRKPVAPAKERPVNMLNYGFASRKPAWTLADSGTLGEVVRIPFIVKNETTTFANDFPAEGGIPFPMGELKTPEQIQIHDAQGKNVPFEARILSRWPDGSIRWLGVSVRTTLPPMDGAGYYLDYGPNIQPETFPTGLNVEEDANSIAVSTGTMKVEFNKKSFYFFKRVSIDQNKNQTIELEEEVMADGALVLTFKGEEYQANLDKKTYTIEVEENGRERVVIKASSWFESAKGKRFCQAVLRYYFYSGKSFVKVSHTLVYTGYPENKYYDKYKGLNLPPNEPIGSFGLRLPHKFSVDPQKNQIQMGRNESGSEEFLLGNTLELYQTDYDHVVLEKDGAKTGLASRDGFYSGWLDVSKENFGVTVALRNLREEFPKAFRVDREKGEILIELWPEKSGVLDLSTTSNAMGPEDRARGNAFGLAKTHELLFYFHGNDPKEIQPADAVGPFMKPLVIRVNPYWMDATGALGRLYPTSDRFGTEEKMLSDLFDWAARHPKDFKWFGMLNFGDTLTWWRDEDDDQEYAGFGWHPIGRWGWYNCEGVGTHTGSLIQFARSGEWKYFEFGRNLARHIMDVDTVHYNTIENDSRLKGILNDEVSKVGSMHRHSGDHWSGRNEAA
ncbi:MAG: hypothetical protein HY582_01760, partial [Candidatus Omnitrophica bacterium]|nr:hypothetical protein [Candidatus Omnitrophota bacterium]